jgi:beta-lactamase class A
MSLQEVISEPSKNFKGILGVAFKHLGSGEQANLNGDRIFPTASVFKVPVILEFYRQVEAGTLGFDDQIILREEDKVPGSGILKELSEGMSVSLRDLLSLMMIVSDNTATDIIVSKVGMDNVNKSLNELGLTKTRVKKYCREMLFDLVEINDLPLKGMTLELYEKASETRVYGGSWSLGVDDNNVTTPNEMNRLLELIVEGKAASSESCEAILQIMAKCQTGAYRIPKYLPQRELLLQRKTGSLPGIRNDVGILTIKKTGERYTLSCFTMDAVDVYAAEEVIAVLSREVYQYLTE